MRLQRPSSHRQRRAQWQRTYRRRVRAGSKLTEVTAAVIELLIEGEWLKPAEAADKRAITQALSRQQRLGDARRGYKVFARSIAGKQFVEVVIKYLKNNPENRQFTAASLIEAALYRAFPCKVDAQAP